MVKLHNGWEYLRSGSPLMLLGASAAGLMISFHIISYRTAFWIDCLAMLCGTAQMLVARRKRE